MRSTTRLIPWATLLLALCAPAVVHAADAEPTSATRAELVMGSIATITLPDGANDAAFEAAFAALRRVDARMSLYRPESDLVRVNAHAAERAEPVDAELFACLERARDLSRATEGAFDPTVLPLLRAWGAYPDLTWLPRGRPDAVGWGGLALDAEKRTVRFRRAGMGVDLGGIAKGFALDRARAALADAGVRHATLDLGGQLLTLGADPARGSRIAVRDPAEPEAVLGVLVLDGDPSVSTSGNYARDFAAEGWRTHSHIFDPRTGRAVRAGLAVTVWAPDGTSADALSTALLVAGPDAAARVLARAAGAGALFVDDGGPARRIVLAGQPPRAFEPEANASRVALSAASRESTE
jgi:thiamine biosynthesis lipoprotein